MMFLNGSKDLILIVGILVVVLVIFGPSQLPKLGQMFGKTMKNVREGMDGTGEDEEDAAPKPKAMKAQAEETEAPKKKTESVEEDAE
jgi:sec-independent protein translocase protein TatA